MYRKESLVEECFLRAHVLVFFPFDAEKADAKRQWQNSFYARFGNLIRWWFIATSRSTVGQGGGESVNLDLHNVYNNMCHATIHASYDLTQHKARHNVGPWGNANPRANMWWPKRWLVPFYSRVRKIDSLPSTNYSAARRLSGARTCWNTDCREV